MTICRNALLPGTIAMFCLAAHTEAQLRSTAKSSSEIQRARWTHLQGMIVENRDGESLGVVKDLIIEMPAGNIKYALVSSGGFLGLRSTRKVVPVLALSDATAKTGILALDISTRRWKKAPQFRKNDLGSLHEPQRAARISAYYAGPRQLRPPQPEAGADWQAPSSATGRDERRGLSNYELASEIVGRDVTNQQKKGVGRISDLLIDLSGHKEPFAIVSTARLFQRNERYAVPLGLMSQSEHQFKVEADATAFRHAPPFSEEAWQTTAASASIYHYVE